MANEITFEIVSGEGCRFSMTNNSEHKTCPTKYRLRVNLAVLKNWENNEIGTVVLGPGKRWSENIISGMRKGGNIK